MHLPVEYVFLSMGANPNTERKRTFLQLVKVICSCQCTSKPYWDRSNPEWQASLSPLCQSTKAMTALLFPPNLKSEKQNNPTRSWQCFVYLVGALATTAPVITTVRSYKVLVSWESPRWPQKDGVYVWRPQWIGRDASEVKPDKRDGTESNPIETYQCQDLIRVQSELLEHVCLCAVDR